MSQSSNNISYIEFKAKDLKEIKKFYNSTFGWVFKDWGDNYVSFSESGVKGGFEKTDTDIKNGVLIVLYHEDLEKVKGAIETNDGKITKDIFEFPGGRRFHFEDPSGNELSVWSEK